MMYQFNATVHTQTPDVPSARVLLRGCELAIWQPTIEQLYAPFDCTFEETAAVLERQARVFFEPDGSFVWGEGAGAERWQIDGHLFDRGGRLLYMHLKGKCPPAVFDTLLSAVGWPGKPLWLQLQQQGYILTEADFRRFAAAPPSSGELQ